MARQLWERNEKLGKSHRPFLAPMKAALVRKIPIKGGTTCCRPLCTSMLMIDDYEHEHEGKWLQILGKKWNQPIARTTSSLLSPLHFPVRNSTTGFSHLGIPYFCQVCYLYILSEQQILRYSLIWPNWCWILLTPIVQSKNFCGNPKTKANCVWVQYEPPIQNVRPHPAHLPPNQFWSKDNLFCPPECLMFPTRQSH